MYQFSAKSLKQRPVIFPNSFSWARVNISLYNISACLYLPCFRYADAWQYTYHRVSQYQQTTTYHETHTHTAEYHHKHIRSSLLIKFSFSSLSLYFSTMVLHSKLSWQPVRLSVLAKHLLLYQITSTHKHFPRNTLRQLLLLPGCKKMANNGVQD